MSDNDQTFAWIDQYKRLKNAHDVFSTKPQTDEERWQYVDMAGTNVKGMQSGEKLYAQLRAVFESGLYERDQEKLAQLKERAEKIFTRFYHDASIYEILEGQAFSVAFELATLNITTGEALESRLKSMPKSKIEELKARYPESFFPEKSERTCWVAGCPKSQEKPAESEYDF